MEFILVIAVIAVLCIIFQVSMDLIIAGIAILAVLIIMAMTILFIYFFIRLLFSKKVEAYFSEIIQPKENKFRTACYIVDGVKYLCVFPAESVLLNGLYKKDKKYHVWLNRRMNRVYDRFAFATCVTGFSVSVLIMTAVIFIYLTV
ncbi:MAG: hypothetical protein NC177_11950 [Ruminococcus flavefaciens]|nr:hypothetical protein [Ruminococcus flavefaciens]